MSEEQEKLIETVAARSANGIRMALADWEEGHHADGPLTRHERELFIYAFQKGLRQGVLEVRAVSEELRAAEKRD